MAARDVRAKSKSKCAMPQGLESRDSATREKGGRDREREERDNLKWLAEHMTGQKAQLVLKSDNRTQGHAYKADTWHPTILNVLQTH